MASGEAEPLQYTTTALRVSIHCEGCKKKVKKVLHNIEGVYKVTVDAAQHKVIVTGSVGADALIRRLNKSGKQAALWPVPAAEAKKKAEEAGEACKDVVADKEKGASEKQQPEAEGSAKKKLQAEAEGSAKKKQQPEAEGSTKKKQDSKGSPEKGEQKDTKQGSPDKVDAAKQKDDGENESEAKEKKGSPEQPAKQEAAAADEGGGGSGKKGGKNKKKNKQQDGGAGEGEAAAAAAEKKAPANPAPAAPPPAAQYPGPERPLGGGFPYYAAQPVMSYNVAHPSASVSYCAPSPAVPLPPAYGYPHMTPPPEYTYGPPGMRSSPPQESYNNMFNEENANSCSLM